MRVNQQDTQEDPAVSVTLYGEDTRVLMGMAQEVERRLESIPGLLSVDTDMDRGGTELQLRLDRGQCGFRVEPIPVEDGGGLAQPSRRDVLLGLVGGRCLEEGSCTRVRDPPYST